MVCLYILSASKKDMGPYPVSIILALASIKLILCGAGQHIMGKMLLFKVMWLKKWNDSKLSLTSFLRTEKIFIEMNATWPGLPCTELSKGELASIMFLLFVEREKKMETSKCLLENRQGKASSYWGNWTCVSSKTKWGWLNQSQSIINLICVWSFCFCFQGR